MLISLRHFALPFLLLIALVAYDNISLLQKSSSDRYNHTKETITKLIAEHEAILLEPDFLELLDKSELSVEDLAKIKAVSAQLSTNKIVAELHDGGKRLFWTKDTDKTNICKAVNVDSLKGRICYAPFDEQGKVDKELLELQGFNNYFKLGVSEQAYEIGSTSIKLGKTIRSTAHEKLILLGYFLVFAVIMLLSIKYANFWPLFGLIVLRIFSITKEWSARFSDDTFIQTFSDTAVSYNSMDLLLDSILMFGCLLFITRKFVNAFQGKMTSWGMAGLSFVHMLVFISHIRLVQLLVKSDRTTLSIEDLGSTSLADLIVFFTIALLQLGIFHFGFALFRNYKTGDFSKVELYSTYGVSIAAAVVMSHFLQLELEPGLLILFLFCYILLMDLFVDVKTVTITWVIWWGIFYSIYLSALFFNYDIKKDIKLREAFLQEVFHEVPHEKIKKQKASGLTDTIGSLVTSLLILPEDINYDKHDLETYIAEKLNRSDVELELFNNKGESLFDDTPTETTLFGKLLEIDSTTRFDEILNTVWFKNPIAENKTLYVGVGSGTNSKAFPFEFNYIRDKRHIVKQQSIRKNELAQLIKTDASVIYLGSDVFTVYKPSNDRLLLSKKSFLGLVKPVALFSFLFSLIIILILSFGLLNYLLKFLPEDWPLFVQNMESLNSKIQISLILVILLSFVIIASITSTFLEDYLSKEKALVIGEKLENLSEEFKNRAKYSTSANESVAVLANYKKHIEDIHNVDLDIYPISNQGGHIDFFTEMYFVKQTEPYAFTNNEESEQSRSYIPIFFNEKIAGVATLEMRSNIQNIQLNVFDFLGSIFNVYVFLFLIASVISIFIAQSITRPLSMLNQNLTQVKLGKQNKQLAWNRDDEIGILIGNYNKMVTKLEESAEILAKNERDSAWREMAKQVAHEIKNPLTPMKLSIQYLEKAIKQQPENATKIARKISTTMLEQIDNLTGIAEAFSNFAELPQTSNVKVELNNIVEVVHNLFRKREDMDILLSVPINPIHVYADKSQLVRILNNLVKNATESIPRDRRGHIELNLYTRNDKAIICVSDNGAGIPDDMKSKIFQPKFTTKDSGSGLGLAIAANMVESMNGKIYFDSEPDEATNFYIELDIIRKPVITDNKERITLD